MMMPHMFLPAGDESISCLTSDDLQLVGFENEFLPAIEGKYECPICLLVLRNPYQTACGHRYCRNCILKWLREEKRGEKCPTCNDVLKEDQLYPDNCVKREIMGLTARCLFVCNGCNFMIELNHVEEHQRRCDFAKILCPGECGQQVLKGKMEEHVRSECPNRTESCPHCKEMKVMTLMEAHESKCPLAEIDCEYCEEKLYRQQMKRHTSVDCPKFVINCPFSKFGCKDQVSRDELASHFEACTQPHLRMLGAKVHTLMLANSSAEMLDLNQDIYNSFTAGDIPTSPDRDLEGERGSDAQFGSAHYSDANDSVCHAELGPDSLTHQMADITFADRPAVHASGTSSATLSGTVPPPPGHDKMETIHREEMERLGAAGAVQGAPSGAVGSPKPYAHSNSVPDDRGYRNGDFHSTQHWATALAHGNVTSSYPQTLASVGEDMVRSSYKIKELERESAKLKQHIVEMQAKAAAAEKLQMVAQRSLSELEGRCCGGIFVWKLHGYARLRLEAAQGHGGGVLHSDGFYTGFHGYKMCIRLNLNGVDSAQGTHVSLFIHLLQGEYDDIVPWPFTGTITLSIMDQSRGRRNHITETLMAKPSLAAFQRPTSMRNHKGFGYMEFAPLKYLESRQFIQNDTLIIRAEVKSAVNTD